MELIWEQIPIRQGLWDQWEAPPYKVVSYQVGEYYAYFHNGTFQKPPDLIKCTGCDDTMCNGVRPAWASLAHAQEDCEDHANEHRNYS